MTRTIGTLALLLALAGCASAKPYATTVGSLKPGSAMLVKVANGTVSAFAPAIGEPRDRFTVSATALPKTTPPPAPVMRPMGGGVAVNAPDPLANLLVRVPDGVALTIDSKQGDVHVTNVTGSARVLAAHGNVQVIVPGYAESTVGVGNLGVTMGSTDWKGTLHFSVLQGDVVLWITETAKFHVHLHTANGTLFTDFDLRGTSEGKSETIDGDVNGGATRAIDVEVGSGAIRLLRLHPEA